VNQDSCLYGQPSCCGPSASEGEPCPPCAQIAKERVANYELRQAATQIAVCVNRYPFLWGQADGKGGLIGYLIQQELEKFGWSGEVKIEQPRSEVAQLAERDGWDCHYCSQPLSGKPDRPHPHVDHVIPKSRGGSESLGNKVLSCPTCNCSKGARTPEEWRNS